MYHYDAFISYNHNPRDNKITRELQRKLESFKLPKGVETHSGKDSIKRVFLDKGELEVSGDLNTIIEDALENSDYLIVICSPESKESIWVHREIEFFLKNHTIDQILTVITEGEPFDVLPEEILYEDIVDENGNTVRNMREPLSCDYRLPVRKADREELPRLIAAIMGCRYDELVQRQKHYRMRRMIALLASAAVLLTSAVGYLIWSNQQIRTNYNKSLREESLNLATQSEEALERGDRIGAIRYALQALPSKDQDRPVVSEAVLAISEALNLYHSSLEHKWNAVRQYTSDFSCYDAIPFSAGGHEYAAGRLAGGRVRIWDADSGDALLTDYTDGLYKAGHEIIALEVSDDGSLLLISNKSIFALDVPSGKEKYRLDVSIPSMPDAEASMRDKYCRNGNTLWAIAFANYENDYCLIRIDIEKGKIVKDIHTGEDLPECLAISPDGKYLAYVHEINNLTEDQLELIDTETGKMQKAIKACISDVRFFGKDKIIICGCNERPDTYDYAKVIHSDYISLGVDYTYTFTDYAYRSLFVSCFASPTLEEIWNKDYSGYYCGMPTFDPAYDQPAPPVNEEDIFCTTGSNMTRISKDGDIIDEIEYQSPIVARGYTTDGSGQIWAILKNGNEAVYVPETKRNRVSHNVFADNIIARRNNASHDMHGLYMITGGSRESDKHSLTKYEVNGIDSRWQPFEQDISYEEDAYAYGFFSSGDCFIEVTGSSNDNTAARIISRKAENGEVVYDKELSSPGTESDWAFASYAGFKEETGKAYFIEIYAGDSVPVITVDAASGDTEFIKLVSSENSTEGNVNKDLFLSEYFQFNDADGEPVVCDEKGGLLYCPVERKTSYLDPDTNEWVEKHSLEIITLDIAAGNYSLMPVKEFSPEDDFSMNDNNMIIDAGRKLLIIKDSSNVISAYDFNGKLKWSADDIPYNIQSMCMTEDGFILTAEEPEPLMFRMHVMDSSKGKEIASTDFGRVTGLDQIGQGVYFKSSCEKVSSGELLLSWNDHAFILDSTDWSLRNKIKFFLNYNEASDSLILGDSSFVGDKKYGRTPYRKLDDIITEGMAVVGED
ncbi:MAG: TIR domain-containing protein [Mogibacterium sp.]|nr:TIR domain-containing protein [Mogibacterium sp.]MBQ6501925.1 TIR domain-containing protein [Mogibacterium sp.]